MAEASDHAGAATLAPRGCIAQRDQPDEGQDPVTELRLRRLMTHQPYRGSLTRQSAEVSLGCE